MSEVQEHIYFCYECIQKKNFNVAVAPSAPGTAVSRILSTVHKQTNHTKKTVQQPFKVADMYLKSVDGLGPCQPISFHCSEIKLLRVTLGKAANHRSLRASYQENGIMRMDGAHVTVKIEQSAENYCHAPSVGYTIETGKERAVAR